MRRYKIVISFAVLLGVSASMFACGGGKSGTSASATASPAASASATADRGDANSVKELQAAATKFAALPAYRVDYNIHLNSAANGSFSATMTMTHKDKATRSDFAGTVNGSATHLTTINDGTKLTICEKEPKETCVQGDASQAASSDPLGSLNTVNILQSVAADTTAKVEPAKSQKLAGINANCYDITQSSQESTFCIDKDTGVLLLADGKSLPAGENQSTETITASATSTNVASVDTKAPYPIATPAPSATAKP